MGVELTVNDAEFKRRRRWGFRFAVVEHRWRRLGYRLLLLGMVPLLAGTLGKSWPLIYAGTAVLAVAIISETVSYIAHKVEKNQMDPIRHERQ